MFVCRQHAVEAKAEMMDRWMADLASSGTMIVTSERGAVTSIKSQTKSKKGIEDSLPQVAVVRCLIIVKKPTASKSAKITDIISEGRNETGKVWTGGNTQES